ncbi:TetR family transcriptional regulator [Fusobacterium sp. PH5-44]|uniref:TetR family transcriptional regulator n=1 Tax=unclassified Fusobacterium TaxID=2648384 RepID=UPI003D1E18BF
MDFERAKTEEQRQFRIQQIKNVAIELFDNNEFHQITLSDIAKGMDFTRGNLYKYISSKEEIYLMIFIDEFTSLLKELKIKLNKNLSKEIDSFATILACEIEKQRRFLKLGSILYTNLEKNVSEDKLIDFMEKFDLSKGKFIKIIRVSFPRLEDFQIKKFLDFLFYFLIGFYPVTSLNKVQEEALKKAKTGYYPPNFQKILKEQIINILRNVVYHHSEKTSAIPYRII